MFPFRKVLFLVDYSAPCEAVVPYLQEIAQRFSANVSLVHALPTTEKPRPAPSIIFETSRSRSLRGIYRALPRRQSQSSHSVRQYVGSKITRI